MTPTPKHIEEAQRLAAEACDKLRFDYPGTLFHVRIPETAKDLSKHLNLPTLLAAQEFQNKEHCEHCGSDRIYKGPPNCPGCGAPNCCQTCCKVTSLEKERDQLCTERDELIKRLEAFNHYTQQDWRETVKEIVKLRTHNAALLAVARAANISKTSVHRVDWQRLEQALSALEPLGIKV